MHCLHSIPFHLMVLFLFRSQCLSERQLRDLYEIGIPQDFYSKQELNSWYRSFLKACDVQGQQQLSRERFHELMRKYAKGQCKKVGRFLDELSDQLFDGFEFPKEISAYVDHKPNGEKCLTRDTVGSYNESDTEGINVQNEATESIQPIEQQVESNESVDETDLSLMPPRALRSRVSADGRNRYISFTQFMAVMTQIKDQQLSKRPKTYACRELQIEWMFKMIAGRGRWRRMEEKNWVDIHYWVRQMDGQKFGHKQNAIVREEFAQMHTHQYEHVGFSDFNGYLENRS